MKLFSDIDSDGVCDEVDNCPEIFNPDQEDNDEPGGETHVMVLIWRKMTMFQLISSPIQFLQLNIIYNRNSFGDIKIKLMNSIGQVLFNENYFSKSNIELQIDLRNYSSGLYQVQFSNEKGLKMSYF